MRWSLDLQTDLGPSSCISELENEFSEFGILMEQYITKSVLDTLRLVTDTPEDVEAVLKVMNKLAIDLGKQHEKARQK